MTILPVREVVGICAGIIGTACVVIVPAVAGAYAIAWVVGR